MYGIIRITIGILFLVGSIIALQKMKIAHKRRTYAVAVCLSIALMTALAFLPFENFFITFDSPESAYEYYNFGKSNIRLIVEGNDCDLVVDRKNTSDTYLIVPKTENGWKIGIGADTRKIAETFVNGISVNVYQYRKIDAFFITILDTNGGESTVSDKYGTEFFASEEVDKTCSKTFVTYFGYLAEFDSSYNITVNGHKVKF